MHKNVMMAVIAGTTDAFAANPVPPSEEEEVREIIARLSSTIPAANAPITIVEFGDYPCTFCHRFHEETKDQLIANYLDTGTARFLFKDFAINDRHRIVP